MDKSEIALELALAMIENNMVVMESTTESTGRTIANLYNDIFANLSLSND